MKIKAFIKNILGHLRDFIIVILIGNLISFLFNQDYSNFWLRVEINSIYSLMIGGTLWKGNQLIGYLVSKKIDQNRFPFQALRWELSLMFVFSLLDIILVNYIWFVVIYNWSPDRLFSNIYTTMIIEFVVTIIITSIFFAIGFFRSWRESIVREERLQKESIKLQYNALKNQVNPHFLFNSLNTLTSLVYRDADQSARFIKQLSEVYRYVLEHRDTELVNINEELEFCKKYIFLQQIRYGEALKVILEIPGNTAIKVVPMAIQLLIENAIKHNQITEDKPLEIRIFLDGDYITVANDLKPRKTVPDSGGIGLDTLKQRYTYLSQHTVKINNENKKFTVMIPVIKSNKA